MNSSALGVILGVLSLAGVALLYTKVDELGERLDSRRETVARGGSESGDNGWLRADKSESARSDDSGESHASGGDPITGGNRSADIMGDDRAALLERIRRLEERDKAREKKDASRPSFRWGAPKFARNVDDLAKRLKLTNTQKTRVQDVVDRTKQRIEDIMRIPGEDGKTPLEKQEEQRAKLKNALAKHKDNPGGLISFAGGFHSYRNDKIPGRNMTYGEEIDRIKGEGKKEIRDSLSPEQQKEFDDTNVDSMMGGGGGSSVAISYVAESPIGVGGSKSDD